jgi:carboxyl-terminal processing protease
MRLVVTAPSLGRVGPVAGGRLMVALDRFGRDAVHELRAAIGDAPGLILDLRANRGGALERMLRVAALFTGPIDAALGLNGSDNRRVLAIPDSPDRLARSRITVLVGRQTASSAEMLAALLRRHGGAEIVGETTFGKDFIYRTIPVDHDWRLLIPAERIDIPGEILAGGLIPDRPAPEAW